MSIIKVDYGEVGGGTIDIDFLNNITVIPQANLTNFIVGKTYFLVYSRGLNAEHNIISGGEIISSYPSTGNSEIGMFIFKATSTTVTITGNSNICYVAQLD
jgi:hypothetical protein